MQIRNAYSSSSKLLGRTQARLHCVLVNCFIPCVSVCPIRKTKFWRREMSYVLSVMSLSKTVKFFILTLRVTSWLWLACSWLLLTKKGRNLTGYHHGQTMLYDQRKVSSLSRKCGTLRRHVDVVYCDHDNILIVDLIFGWNRFSNWL